MEPLIRRQYTADYKAQAVSLVASLGLAGAARKLGIDTRQLGSTGSRWNVDEQQLEAPRGE